MARWLWLERWIVCGSMATAHLVNSMVGAAAPAVVRLVRYGPGILPDGSLAVPRRIVCRFGRWFDSRRAQRLA